MNASEKVIDRIRKLLALGAEGSGATENEAAIAMRRAHALLAQYNIDMADVEEGKREEPIEREHFEYGGFGNAYRSGPWARMIAKGIADLNFCGYYYRQTGTHSDRHTFIGRPVNREIARMVAAHVIGTIAAEAKRGAAANKHDAGWLNSFRNAASDRIFARCRELVEQAKRGEAQNENGGAMVLASLYEREQNAVIAWSETNLNLRKAKSATRSSSLSGRAAGNEAGNRVSLRPEVGTPGRKALGRG